jgi:hypothetical protein
MGSVTDWLVEVDLGAGAGSAETEFCLLFGPVEGDAGADEAFETELGGLGAFKNGRLYLWRQKRQRRPGADVGFGVTFAPCNLCEAHALPGCCQSNFS